MKKIISMTALLLVLVMAVSLCSCGGSSIVGNWEFGANTYEFTKDGSFSMSVNGLTFAGTYTAQDGKLTLSYNSIIGRAVTTELDYEIEGNTLTLSGDVTLLGSTVELQFTKVK